jgi:2-oxo-4-hydroxy-4-carboxy-5-ureidoimidazoline decarboxylase
VVTEPHQVLNTLDPGAAAAVLERCCGARRWVAAMLARRPFPSHGALLEAAEQEWQRMERPDLLEAFGHHPRIGASLDELRARFPATSAWSRQEQRQVEVASDAELEALAAGNQSYQARFGFIFIVCATGKSAGEMLALLQARLANPPALELATAAAEQAKITRLRLEQVGA